MKTVGAVVVTYRNTEKLLRLLEDLTAQTRPPDPLVVVDNSAGVRTQEAIAERFPAVDYLPMPENTGSAGGYHAGIRAVLEKSDFVWTLDDDVRLRADALEELLKGWDALKRGRKLGAVRCVGPSHVLRVPTRLRIIPWRGTLFSRQAISDVSLPLPEYFLYGEDLDYSLRLARAGYECFCIPSSVCREDRRDGKMAVRLFSRTKVVYSSPFRLYYAFRNETFISCKFAAPVLFCRTLLYGLKLLVFLGLSGNERRSEQIRAILNGLGDGWAGRLGKHPGYSPEMETERID